MIEVKRHHQHSSDTKATDIQAVRSRLREKVPLLAAFVLALLFCTAFLWAGEEKKLVRVGIFQNEPIIFQDENGVAKGLYADILNAVAEEENWEIQYVLDSWDGCLDRIRTGNIDLLSCIAYTEERDAYADFSREVVWTLWGVVFVHPESGIEDVPSMDGKKVAVLRNGINGINFQTLCEEFGVTCEIMPLPSYDAAFKAVESGEADAVIVNSVFGALHGPEYQVNRTSIIFSPIDAFFAVPHGQNSELAATVDTYLENWKHDNNSVYHRSLHRHLTPIHESTLHLPDWIFVALSALAFGLLSLFVWVRLLRRVVNTRTATLLIVNESLRTEIADRKHAEEELRDSEETHRGLIENLPQRIFHKDADLVYVSCNEHFARDLGIASEEIAGKTDFDFYPREMAEKYREEDRRVMASCQTEAIDESFIKNGQELWVHTIKTPLTDDSGHVTGILRIYWDITERKRAEEQLRRSEVRYKNLVEKSGIAILIDDVDGNIVYSNERFSDMFGYSRAEIKHLNIRTFIHPDDIEKVMKRHDDRLQRKETATEYEFTGIRKDGSTRHFMVTTGAKEEKGKIVGTRSYIRDITERKQAEEALRASEEKFRKYIAAAPDGIFVADAEGRLVEVNQAACELTGYTEAELTSMAILDIIDPETHTEVLERFGNLKKTGGHRTEFKLKRKDGSMIWSSLNAVTLSEDRFMAFCYDITETKRLQALESRAERLETAGTIAGQVAHDFNNLLAPLMAYPDFIREELPKDHPALAYIDDIENSAKQIAEINQQLLTLGRRGHYIQKPLNMNTIVYQAIRELSPLPKTLTIDTELEKNLLNFKGGGSQIHRILSNLLSNAMEAMQDIGRILIKTESHYADDVAIAYGRVPKGEYVKLTISDTGCGILDDILQKVFDPFFTSKTTDKKRGSGLGLSVVDAVIKDHKGYLDLTTKVGVGTSFYLYFPVCRGNTEADEVENLAGGAEKVLIVDDDDIQREVSQRVLVKLGYKVSSVDSGEKAIELLREYPQDIVILDMVMPGGIDGAETYRRMLEVSPQQKAIILSGYSESGRVLEAQKLGAGAFVKKPVTRGTIAAAVRKELERVVSVAS